MTSITGVDTCPRALERLRNRIGSGPERPRVTLVRSCATRLKVAPSRVDCALLVEVIEHISPDRLSALERSVFSQMRARTVVVTTPNADFNALLGVPAHRFRHRDHRFEWGRKRFRAWANGLAARHDYRVEFSDIGGSHPTWGGPSQMAVFDARANGMNDPRQQEEHRLDHCLRGIEHNIDLAAANLRHFADEAQKAKDHMWEARRDMDHIDKIAIRQAIEQKLRNADVLQQRHKKLQKL